MKVHEPPNDPPNGSHLNEYNAPRARAGHSQLSIIRHIEYRYSTYLVGTN